MLPQLFTEDAITQAEKKNIEAEQLERNGMQYFLDQVLILSLDLGTAKIYIKFIKVLKDSDSIIQRRMANLLGESLYLRIMLCYNFIQNFVMFEPVV